MSQSPPPLSTTDEPPTVRLEFAHYEEATPADAAMMFSHAVRAPELAESAGDVVGLYTLVEKLGDGGFGSVWRADQTEPMKREVALKIIKLGMDTLEVMSRFEQERAALALMDHPNIARVFDAGATPEGRPFFVMELVHGVSITHYCHEKQLPLEQRLTLFKSVCAGVHHAHQKGIIHRDLKPSNILVTEVDGVPVPKIIDFGIAKATTTDKLTAFTLVTRMEQLVGTPLYMSPEQADASPDIDTRSDVYSLGVLLYELLTGQPPFDAETLMAKGLEEMRRIIREVEPQPPSRRNDEERMANDKTKTRQTTASVIRTSSFGFRVAAAQRQFSDLDHITLRALEKDRSRRYESATALGEDIRRFLNHEPVNARAPSVAYLMQRWMRRHRVIALAAGVSLLAILAGAGIAVWQAVRATRAQHLAERQLVDAEAVTKVITDTLAQLNSFGASPTIERTDLMRQMVARVRAFAGDPMRKVRLLTELARAVRPVNAVAIQAEALALAEPLLGPDDPQLWRLRYELAMTKAMLGDQRKAAIPDLRRAFEWYRAHLGADDPLTVHVTYTYARNLNFTDDHARALQLLEEVNRIASSRPQDFRAGERVFFQMDYTRALKDAGRIQEALDLGRENTRLALKELGPADFEAARAFLTHAKLCRGEHLVEEAANTARQALDMFLRSTGPLDTYSVEALELLIEVQKQRGDTEALLAVHRDAVRAHDAKLGPAHAATAARVKQYSQALVSAGRAAEADALNTDWLKRVRLSDGTLPIACEEMLRGQIEALRATTQLPRAEAALRELVAMVAKERPQDLQRYGDQSNLANVLINQGRKAEAVPLLEETVRVLEERGSDNERVKQAHLEQAKRRLAEARR